MIVEIGGGKGGFKEYLEHGQKQGRDFHRNELDQRVPLSGDLDVFEIATTHEGNGRKYDHITLSFSESHVTDKMLKIAVDEFRNHALAAWPESERHRIAFYAEAHRPKILSYTNTETGKVVDRFVHIHIGLGRRDLLTGKAIEPLGFFGPMSDNLKYIDAWQESFNARHGFASPKDNPNITAENGIDVLARYSGSKSDALGTFNQRKSALEVVLQKEVIEKHIVSWKDFGTLLSEHGEVSVMRQGRQGECYRVKPTGMTKAIRLKGIFFQRQFIERPTCEKQSIISEKAKIAYLEQMQPRKAPEYVAKVLQEWNSLKAREHRYLHSGSKFFKEVYQPADAPTRVQILNEIERKINGIPSSTVSQRRKIAPARNRVPRMRIRNLDGIQRRTQMLLRSDAGMDVPTDVKARYLGVELRQADGRAEDRIGGSGDDSRGVRPDHLSREIGGRGRSVDAGRHQDAKPRVVAAGDSESGWVHPMGKSSATRGSRDEIHIQEERWDRGNTDVFGVGRKDKDGANRPGGEIEVGLTRHGGRLFEGNEPVQPSSVLARVQADMLERYEQAADKEKYAEIRANIDCLQLLSGLSHSHGLNPMLYPVKSAQDGTPRIQCGSRSLSPSDFLMKELGLPWKEAAPILRRAYEQQIGKKITTPRGRSAPSQLWSEFKAEQLAGKPAATQRLKEFDGETQTRRTTLFAALKAEEKQALKGLTGVDRKAAQSLEKFRAAMVNAEFRKERKEARQSLQPLQAHAWRLFLQTRAQAGNEEALATLRRLDDAARAMPAQSITGTIYLGDDEEEEQKHRRRARETTSAILKMLAHKVELNGDVTYSQNGHAVLRDEGQRLAVLDPNSDEAIAAALLLGREKFGTDLTLTGSPEFQRRVVEVAVAQGSPVRFVDPQLEAMRLQLTKEKRQAAQPLKQEKVDQAPAATGQAVAQAGHHAEPSHLAEAAPTTSSNKSAKRGIKMPVLVPEVITHAAELSPEVVPKVVPTAAQWMAMQHSLVDKPYSKGAGDTEFNVLYVAFDGVVVSHGRGIATYSIPTDIALQVGSRVVIDSNGALCLPREPEPGKEKDKGIG